MNDGLGKQAEQKIRDWLDVPEQGRSFDRLYDQLTGYYLTSRNICDFIYYKYPNIYYIESKATWQDRFSFSSISKHQHDGLLEKSQIPGAFGVVIILFATYKRTFAIDIQCIEHLEKLNKHSLNINKIASWGIPYTELSTIPNSRKKLLDYCGELVVRRFADDEIY